MARHCCAQRKNWDYSTLACGPCEGWTRRLPSLALRASFFALRIWTKITSVPILGSGWHVPEPKGEGRGSSALRHALRLSAQGRATQTGSYFEPNPHASPRRPATSPPFCTVANFSAAVNNAPRITGALGAIYAPFGNTGIAGRGPTIYNHNGLGRPGKDLGASDYWGLEFPLGTAIIDPQPLD